MGKRKSLLLAFGLAFATIGVAQAAPPDWSKVEASKIVLFYPGATPMEWIMKGTDHGGARAVRKGETCVDCHRDETADMGVKMVNGQKAEPTPPKGKAGSIPVSVQAAHDGQNLYMRFQWKQPAAGGDKADAENQVKLAMMLEGNQIDLAGQAGCWASCHNDSRTMPGAADDKKTKYVKDASVDGGKFFDLLQWRSSGKSSDGHVAESRVMEGGSALVSAEGKQDGDTWTVTFTRKLTGGKGDVALESGKTYNFGFAIHDDHATGRFHHVSLGYKLGLDAKADVNAVKQ